MEQVREIKCALLMKANKSETALVSHSGLVHAVTIPHIHNGRDIPEVYSLSVSSGKF